MSHHDKEQDFNCWVEKLDSEMQRRVGCMWLDLCGEDEPIEGYYDAGFTPEAAVTHWIEKYDLTDLEDFL